MIRLRAAFIATVLLASAVALPAEGQAPPSPPPAPGSLQLAFTSTVDCGLGTSAFTFTLSKAPGSEGLTFHIGSATITSLGGGRGLLFMPNPIGPGDSRSSATINVPFGGVEVSIDYTIEGSTGVHNVGLATSTPPFEQVCPIAPPVTTPPVTITVSPAPGSAGPTPSSNLGAAIPVASQPTYTG